MVLINICLRHDFSLLFKVFGIQQFLELFFLGKAFEEYLSIIDLRVKIFDGLLQVKDTIKFAFSKELDELIIKFLGNRTDLVLVLVRHVVGSVLRIGGCKTLIEFGNIIKCNFENLSERRIVHLLDLLFV